MDKRRLAVLLDAALVLAIWRLMDQMQVWPKDWAEIWEAHARLFRVGTTELWLVALWLGAYRPMDAARRVSLAAVLFGAAQALGTLGMPWCSELITYSNARFRQSLYGGAALAVAVIHYGFQLALERANADAPDCLAASRSWRRALAVAVALLALGLVLCLVCYRAAARVSVALAGLWLLGWELSEVIRGCEQPGDTR